MNTKKFDVVELRSKLDLNGKYVDFNSIRTATSVLTVIETLAINKTKPNQDGECRGDCPKCQKARSFALNVNTNRFNCFNKSCSLRGGGAIDFVSKLFETNAKEASHLIACAYGIQPYSAEGGGASRSETAQSTVEKDAKADRSENEWETISRTEFEKLKTEFDRFRSVVYVFMLEHDQTGFETEEFDSSPTIVQIQ